MKGIAVLLSEAPVDVEAAVASLDPHTQAINQDALSTANYITINIWPGGTVAMNATISESMMRGRQGEPVRDRPARGAPKGGSAVRLAIFSEDAEPWRWYW